MRRGTVRVLALCLSLLVAIAVSAAADKKAKTGNLNGTVRMINKDTSTITVRKGNVERQIVYNANTKFVQGTQKNNKPATVDELKDGWYVHCAGTFDGTKLVASNCRFRQEQRTTQQ